MLLKKTTKQEILSISHYNILNGGEGRLNDILKVIKGINPDICGLLEAVKWQNKSGRFRKIANNLGYKFVHLAVANSKYNIAVFSKLPIGVKVIKKGIRHVALEATVKSGPFKRLSIFFIHLSPASEDARLLEIKELLKHAQKLSQAVIMGDLNSLSCRDPYNRRKILKAFQKNSVTKYGTRKLRFDVIKKLNSAGFKDAMFYLKRSFAASTPTPSNKDVSHSASVRIDYAFLSKNILKYLKEAKVFKNRAADKASDHYPMYIKLIKNERGS